MMKKILLAALIVAFFATSCNNSGTTPGASAEENVAAVASSQIAYVNFDTLISQYTMYLDLRDNYEDKAKKADADLSSRARSLERSIQDFQEKIEKRLVTNAQAQQMEQDLTQRQQNFMQHREKVMGELAEEEQVMLNQIHYGITEYLKEFNKDKRYGMILSTSMAGPILNADPALDITKDVLAGLNQKYTSEKK